MKDYSKYCIEALNRIKPIDREIMKLEDDKEGVVVDCFNKILSDLDIKVGDKAFCLVQSGRTKKFCPCTLLVKENVLYAYRVFNTGTSKMFALFTINTLNPITDVEVKKVIKKLEE